LNKKNRNDVRGGRKGGRRCEIEPSEVHSQSMTNSSSSSFTLAMLSPLKCSVHIDAELPILSHRQRGKLHPQHKPAFDYDDSALLPFPR